MRRATLLLGLALLLGGCAADTRLRVARFLFDGVPADTGEAEGEARRETAPLPERSAPAVSPPPLFTHEPYGRGDCQVCHDAQASASPTVAMLKKPVPALCFDCHAQEKIEEAHGQIGDCAACHNPHQSPNEYLLDIASEETAPAGPAGEQVDQVTGATGEAAPAAGTVDPPDQATGATPQ